MKLFIVTNERLEPVGVYVDEKLAHLKKAHYEKGKMSLASVFSFELELKAFVLCENDFPIGVYTTLDLAGKAEASFKEWRAANAPAGAPTSHVHLHDFKIDAEAQA